MILLLRSSFMLGTADDLRRRSKTSTPDACEKHKQTGTSTAAVVCIDCFKRLSVGEDADMLPRGGSCGSPSIAGGDGAP
jgi:hypothetical protein